MSNIRMNILEAESSLKRVKLLKFKDNYSFIFDSDDRIKDGLAIIGISGEKLNFHEINFVSCNTKAHIGYTIKELLGRDLALIIPNPLKIHHKEMIKPSNSTGIIYESKVTRQLFVKSKGGNIESIKLVVRINYNLQRGLQILGGMYFENIVQKIDDINIIVSEDLNIIEMNKQGEKYFEVGKTIFNYNKSLKSIFLEMNKIATFKLQNLSYDLNQIMKDQRDLEAWKTHFRMEKGKKFIFKTKDGLV